MKLKTLLLLSSLLISASLFSQTTESVLKVEGEATLFDTPEEMNIQIPLRSEDSVYSICFDQLTEKYNFLVSTLINNGIEKEQIKSNGLSIEEKYIWTEKERKNDGYIGSLEVSLVLKYSPDKLNTILKSLKNNSYNILYNVSFQLSQSQRNSLLDKAIQEAIKDASNKAKIIAASLNLNLREIKEINFDYTSNDFDILSNKQQINYASAMGGEGQNLQLSPEKISIKKSIGIIWQVSKQ